MSMNQLSKQSVPCKGFLFSSHDLVYVTKAKLGHQNFENWPQMGRKSALMLEKSCQCHR